MAENGPSAAPAVEIGLPWRLHGNFQDRIITSLEGPAHEFVADCKYLGANKGYAETCAAVLPTVRMARAAFIVKAANCHNDLLAALKEAVSLLENGDHPHVWEAGVKAGHAAIARAEAK